jgi:phage-related protein
MAYDIGPKIGIEGEAEYKKAIAGINKDLSVLGSEMKKVTAQFSGNADSMQALTAKQDVYNKRADEQRKKIELMTGALDKAKKEYGENSDQVKNWQIKLNNAEADLAKTENSLKEITEQMDDFGKESKDGGDAVEKAGKQAGDSEGRFSKLGGVLKGLAAGMGTVAVAAGAIAVKLGKEVVQAFSELEQNLGGSEAVFGEYAAAIQKSGEEAYKNLGVSQSDYLATANKMGALFQGSGIDQQTSLELTEKAMQRAADMASVMGIDMSSAMEAVTGAAKGNYTMMDNLGVKMDDTSVKAFAMANGFKGAWSEASNADKAQYAMQMFFKNTEQYAGNFAKESTQTISGSIGMLKAATESFIAGLGNADADVKNLTGNMVEAFQTVIANIVPIIENLTAALPIAFTAILDAVGELVPTLLETATALFEQVLEAVLQMLPELIPVAVEALLTVVNTLIDNLPLIIDGALQLILALAMGIADALPELIPAAVDAVITIVETLIDNIDLLVDASIAIIVAVADGLIKALPRLIEKVPGIIISLMEAIIENAPKLLLAAAELIVQLTAGLVKGFLDILKKVGGWINTSIVQPIKNKVSDFFNIGGELITGVWNGISDKATWLWNKVSGFFSTLTSKIKDFFGIASPSKLFAGYGGHMAEGLGMGFGDAMKSVSQQMLGAVPTSFGANMNVALNRGKISGLINRFNIGQLVVREEADIKRIATELYRLQQRASRGRAYAGVNI